FRRAAPAIGAAPALRPASFIGGLFRSTFAVSHFGDWSMGPKLSTSYERYSAPSALLGRDNSQPHSVSLTHLRLLLPDVTIFACSIADYKSWPQLTVIFLTDPEAIWQSK